MSNQNYIFTLSPDTFLPYILKLRNVGSAKYGGDWHSTPHVHNYTELFYIVGGQDSSASMMSCFPSARTSW